MKKKVLSFLMVAMFIVALAACGGGSAGTESDDGAEAEASGGDAAQEVEPIVIKAAHVEAEEAPIHQSFVQFKEYVEAESGGSISVEIYPNGELGSERQVLEAVNLGTVQFSAVTMSNFVQYDDRFSIISLPFLFESYEQQEEAVNGPFGQLFLDWMEEYGFVGYGYQYDGARCISNSKRPINTVADMNGLKIRVMESPIFISMFELMGANPTPMSFTEVYTALQQGTVDGQDNPPSLTYDSKFYEVQKYYSLTGHVYSEVAVVSNKAFMESIPQEQRDILTAGAEQYLVDWQRELARSLESEYVQKIRDAGVTEVNDITPENIRTFIDAVAPIYDEYRELVGAEVFDGALALIP
jgi:tripartite ATP-independent transporter DctP family solute receptor